MGAARRLQAGRRQDPRLAFQVVGQGLSRLGEALPDQGEQVRLASFAGPGSEGEDDRIHLRGRPERSRRSPADAPDRKLPLHRHRKRATAAVAWLGRDLFADLLLHHEDGAAAPIPRFGAPGEEEAGDLIRQVRNDHPGLGELGQHHPPIRAEGILAADLGRRSPFGSEGGHPLIQLQGDHPSPFGEAAGQDARPGPDLQAAREFSRRFNDLGDDPRRGQKVLAQLLARSQAGLLQGRDQLWSTFAGTFSLKTWIRTFRLPHCRASAFDMTQMSIFRPLIAPPVSAATAKP